MLSTRGEVSGRTQWCVWFFTQRSFSHCFKTFLSGMRLIRTHVLDPANSSISGFSLNEPSECEFPGSRSCTACSKTRPDKRCLHIHLSLTIVQSSLGITPAKKIKKKFSQKHNKLPDTHFRSLPGSLPAQRSFFFPALEACVLLLLLLLVCELRSH